MNLSNTLKNIDILQLFKSNLFTALTASEIEEKLKLSHHPVFRRLKMLEKEDIVIREKKGYRINIQNPLAFEIMQFLENIEKIEHGR